MVAMQLVIAEKPSVARDLARVLGVRGGGRSQFEGDGKVITFCVGHLVELDEPANYDPRWKAWRLDTLPMVPPRFRLRPVTQSREQFDVVRTLLCDKRFDEVVNACDAGREGELIFRYAYDLAGSRLPVRRLWISSMTDEAIRDGFARLYPGAKYDNLADAARCRSEADWLVGLNATRAVTVRHRKGADSPLYSIGRVQTPTLGLIVGREREIRDFVPRDYFEVKGAFTTPDGKSFTGGWAFGKSTRLGNQAAADSIVLRAKQDAQGPLVEKVEQKRAKEPPPALFDLTTLQRTANRRFGLSAAATLDVAQALYERHKILTYPRTDARHLSLDLRAEMPRILRGVGQHPLYRGFVDPLLPTPPAVGKRVFDDSKVSDHHAIIPTGKPAPAQGLTRDEERIYDLVVRRFIGAFYPDAEFAATEVVVRVGAESDAKPKATADQMLNTAPPPPDRFMARGRVRLVPGWQDVAGFGDEPAPAARTKKSKTKDTDDAPEPEATLPAVNTGERLTGVFSTLAKQTKPPPRHTEATLLGAMETAGRFVDDDELRAAMKDTGLGTPATRAAIIETLFKRTFVIRDGKALVPTDAGMALIDAVPVKSLASPELTGQWEARLQRVARGQDTRVEFMKAIVAYVHQVVDAVRGESTGGGRPVAQTPPRVQTQSRAQTQPGDSCPRCQQGRIVAGKQGWGCSRWREGCDLVIWFEVAGKLITTALLRELLSRGETQVAPFAAAPGGTAGSGRLVLDLNAPRTSGAARFEPG